MEVFFDSDALPPDCNIWFCLWHGHCHDAYVILLHSLHHSNRILDARDGCTSISPPSWLTLGVWYFPEFKPATQSVGIVHCLIESTWPLQICHEQALRVVLDEYLLYLHAPCLAAQLNFHLLFRALRWTPRWLHHVVVVRLFIQIKFWPPSLSLPAHQQTKSERAILFIWLPYNWIDSPIFPPSFRSDY